MAPALQPSTKTQFASQYPKASSITTIAAAAAAAAAAATTTTTTTTTTAAAITTAIPAISAILIIPATAAAAAVRARLWVLRAAHATQYCGATTARSSRWVIISMAKWLTISVCRITRRIR